MKTNRFWLFTMALGMLTACTSHKMHRPQWGSKNVQSVVTQLDIIPVEDHVEFIPANIASDILTASIEVENPSIKSDLNRREKNYTATYQARASATGFWHGNRVRLPHLILSRQFPNDRKTKKPALRIVLTPELSGDRLAFRYKLDSLELNYSEAKVSRSKQSLTMEIDLRFIALTHTNGQYVKKEMGENAFILEGVNFGQNTFEHQYSGWFPVLKPIRNSDDMHGNYEFILTVKEANPSVISTQKILRFFKDRGETLDKVTNITIKQHPKEEE